MGKLNSHDQDFYQYFINTYASEVNLMMIRKNISSVWEDFSNQNVFLTGKNHFKDYIMIYYFNRAKYLFAI